MAKCDIATKDKLLLSCKEAAAMLNTSEPTLRAMVDVGVIKCLKIKGVMKFYVFELHDFCKRMTGKHVDPDTDEVIRDL